MMILTSEALLRSDMLFSIHSLLHGTIAIVFKVANDRSPMGGTTIYVLYERKIYAITMMIITSEVL